MAGEYSGSRSSNTQLLAELEALSENLYQKPQVSVGNRRTNSLALPRSSVPSLVTSADEVSTARIEDLTVSKPRARRLSLSPWRSRPKLEVEEEENVTDNNRSVKKPEESSSGFSGKEEKKGIWNWKPIRGLVRIGMQKLSCLLSVEVVAAQNLPASMNGLRLGVCVRKKETKDSAVQTMPCRVSQGCADFEETLFIKCHVYYSPANGKGAPAKFEARPFLIYLFAVDAKELEFGRHVVDLSELIQESVEKMSYEGARVRQWDMSWGLSGKAKGGDLVLKLGFQIMEKDGGAGIYGKQGEFGIKPTSKAKNFSGSFARKQSKTSFSVPSPKMTSRSQAWTPASGVEPGSDLQGMEHLNLDEPEEKPVQKTEEPEQRAEEDEQEEPDFEVVDKGVEFDDDIETEKSYGTVGERSVEMKEQHVNVDDPRHIMRLTELDSIAKQIKALESSMMKDESDGGDGETESQRLDEEEQTVTKEFLQLLEDEETEKLKFYQHKMDISELRSGESVDDESENYLSDLGKGIGCVVQTRDGGYLVSMNPFDAVVMKKDTPKLVMQISKQIVVLPEAGPATGFELFHRMAGLGEELESKISSLMAIDELIGKTGEQVAFEGIASAIIQGRNKERANTSAARTVAAVKTMANAMSIGRRERIMTGIWNVEENQMTSAEEVLAASLQKLEEMVIEGLKIQADMVEDDAPFEVSAAKGQKNPLETTIPLDEWQKGNRKQKTLTVLATVQLRDPTRRYEAVGGTVVVAVQAEEEEEKGLKVGSLHIGGVKTDATEKRRLTAAQWLVEHGMGKKGKNKSNVKKKDKGAEEAILWSLSSRVMADMWLKSIRNPDVKLHS
ncbi:PREDICTED: protein PLASTID MOVEMENT IMPAIRED 1 isoform X2 [Camelina sativa]|uniref:Protein PLASTID MOVEMENT IMPAIRED 1 isoform X1 n=1 Tax=Camelina sativa TaxID=90675 RepID=A0ABM1R8K3_CAMSA|nr:PREDICTED: protein PLASTID MOVEMENT IMPAIRED 1 isoform X1 [Camelina sativa]XP_019095341.1 PREDICTED: protein PLASTID MOVEMENT IMPAIRED 1 isoform X2 [Camelina sativa]